MSTRLVGVLIIVIGVVVSACAQSEETELTYAQEHERLQCGPHQLIVEQLRILHEESLLLWGVGPNGNTIVEIFVSDSGTWSMVVTNLSGVACMVTYGTGLRIVQGEKA